MSPEVRAVLAADRVIADPAHGPEHVGMAISAAVTDYRRAFARRMIAAGVSQTIVWAVMRELPVDRRLPAALVAPLAPGYDE